MYKTVNPYLFTIIYLLKIIYLCNGTEPFNLIIQHQVQEEERLGKYIWQYNGKTGFYILRLVTPR